jgi:hypothetical protein
LSGCLLMIFRRHFRVVLSRPCAHSVRDPATDEPKVRIMSFDNMLNRPFEHEAAYSNADHLVNSPEASDCDSPNIQIFRHKYSQSTSSTASFLSSASTNFLGSHSRKSSSTTIPETPSADQFILCDPPLNNNHSRPPHPTINTQMADHPAHSAFNRPECGNPAEDPNLPQHLYDRVSNLIVDDGSRADSPTDAVMPLMRRPAPSQEPANR